jgi:hypothetical protein
VFQKIFPLYNYEGGKQISQKPYRAVYTDELGSSRSIPYIWFAKTYINYVERDGRSIRKIYDAKKWQMKIDLELLTSWICLTDLGVGT